MKHSALSSYSKNICRNLKAGLLGAAVFLAGISKGKINIFGAVNTWQTKHKSEEPIDTYSYPAINFRCFSSSLSPF
ncbi:MAG TPA: hypothetical protein PKA63_00580 [Oligoflexia bacterium]|nr:hypothetical protein [Oligoflexia bacterium]HMP47145.1 hypothetical protein [Oligoflexia bacterium]